MLFVKKKSWKIQESENISIVLCCSGFCCLNRPIWPRADNPADKCGKFGLNESFVLNCTNGYLVVLLCLGLFVVLVLFFFFSSVSWIYVQLCCWTISYHSNQWIFSHFCQFPCSNFTLSISFIFPLWILSMKIPAGKMINSVAKMFLGSILPTASFARGTIFLPCLENSGHLIDYIS